MVWVSYQKIEHLELADVRIPRQCSVVMRMSRNLRSCRIWRRYEHLGDSLPYQGMGVKRPLKIMTVPP